MIKPTRGEDEEADFYIKVTENNQNSQTPQTSQNSAAKQIKVNKIKLRQVYQTNAGLRTAKTYGSHSPGNRNKQKDPLEVQQSKSCHSNPNRWSH
ncbi:MAG: hypothetical protein ACLRYY_03480 [Anaerobutyricum soehngenii]